MGQHACKHTWIRLAIIGVLLLLCKTALAESYIHGYFRYTITDQSVTITAYLGEESTVTVPNMIGGNPVNRIASGAFASNPAVKTVYLPDTIVTVEEGAFSPGQTVIFAGREKTEQTESQNPVLGIRNEDGTLITTDDQGNLILVDVNGNETVLDDTQHYTVVEDEEGVGIRGENGNAVKVSEGVIEIDNGSQNKTYDLQSSKMKVRNEETATDLEEAEAPEIPVSQEQQMEESQQDILPAAENPIKNTDTEKTVEANPKKPLQPNVNPAEEETATPYNGPVLLWVMIPIAVLGGIGAFLLIRKRKKSEG